MPADGRRDLTRCLTLTLLSWRIWWAPNSASRWQMGFNLAFKGLIWLRIETGCGLLWQWQRTFGLCKLGPVSLLAEELSASQGELRGVSRRRTATIRRVTPSVLYVAKCHIFPAVLLVAVSLPPLLTSSVSCSPAHPITRSPEVLCKYSFMFCGIRT